MVTKRIIPCLDIRNGRVVKGVNFKGVQDVEDPVALARRYNDAGADELVFYDITASVEGRGLFTDVLRDVARQIFIPLTVGGAINTLEDFDRVLKAGADKVSVNSGAIKDPALIGAAAKKYGDQCVVLSHRRGPRGRQIPPVHKRRARGYRSGRTGMGCARRSRGRGGDRAEQHRYRRREAGV